MIPGWQMEAYERLRVEIVKTAVLDLKSAMRKSDRLGVLCGEQVRLEKWFLSGWGQFLCEGRGEYIIEKCRKLYKRKAYRNGKPLIEEETQKAICADYESGMTSSEIFDKYMITTAQLSRILKRWYK